VKSDTKYNPLTLAKKYFKYFLNGEATVFYKPGRGLNSGRLYANGGLSLQSIKRRIRHTVAGDLYDDVDMVNAHPTILAQLC